MEKEETIKAYKGFDKDLKCRGFQYEVGKEYETGGEVQCCSNGFHACESPLDVLGYYFLDENAEMCRFCEVEQSGNIDKENKEDTKIASSKIKIKAELKFKDLIRLGIEWVQEKTIKRNDKLNSDNGKNSAKIGSSGYSAKIGSSGDSAQIGSSGYYAQIGSSGDYAQIGSSGYSAKIGSSGDYAQIGSSGYSAKIGSSGDSAKIGSSGDSAKIGSSGYSAKINSTGQDSVICCAGHNAVVKAKAGSWITLAEWHRDEDSQRWKPKCVKTEYVDGERIKADTWYMLKDGEFVEVTK